MKTIATHYAQDEIQRDELTTERDKLTKNFGAKLAKSATEAGTPAASGGVPYDTELKATPWFCWW